MGGSKNYQRCKCHDKCRKSGKECSKKHHSNCQQYRKVIVFKKCVEGRRQDSACCEAHSEKCYENKHKRSNKCKRCHRDYRYCGCGGGYGGCC